MKKFLLLLIITFFISGCGTMAKDSEFWEHDSMYKDFDHLKFSWSGHKSPSDEELKSDNTKEWWGKEVFILNDK
jgi:hypothetical protein